MKNALIAAIVAAVVAAASGTAATLVVTSKTIKNGTIQTVDISAKAKRALKGNRGLRGRQGPAGAQGAPGAAGAAGAPGPPGVQGLSLVTNTVSVLPATFGSVTADCPSGQRSVSGGFNFGGIIHGSYRGATGWVAGGYNDDPGSPRELTAFAYCSPNLTS
jgi:hypothetical protein